MVASTWKVAKHDVQSMDPVPVKRRDLSCTVEAQMLMFEASRPSSSLKFQFCGKANISCYAGRALKKDGGKKKMR